MPLYGIFVMYTLSQIRRIPPELRDARGMFQFHRDVGAKSSCLLSEASDAEKDEVAVSLHASECRGRSVPSSASPRALRRASASIDSMPTQDYSWWALDPRSSHDS